MNESLWLIISILLVFSMPFGLGLFYAGAVRSKNAISSMVQVIILIPIVCVLWYGVGYQMIFGKTQNGYIGEIGKSFFNNFMMRGIT